MEIGLRMFGAAFLLLGAFGLFRVITLDQVAAGAAVWGGLILLFCGALLARLGKGK